MSKESVRLSESLQRLLRRRATQKGLSFSAYVRELIERGLNAEPVPTQKAVSKIDRYILQVVLENLLIQQQLVVPHQQGVIEKAQTEARAFIKALLEAQEIAA